MNQQNFEQKVIRHNQLLELLNQGDLLPRQAAELWALEKELEKATTMEADSRFEKFVYGILLAVVGAIVLLFILN